MLIVKDLIEILQKYHEDTPIMLYDANKDGACVMNEYGEKVKIAPSLPHNSFDNVLECRVTSVTVDGKEQLIQRHKIRIDTKEIVATLVPHDYEDKDNPPMNVLLITPDPIEIYIDPIEEIKE